MCALEAAVLCTSQQLTNLPTRPPPPLPGTTAEVRFEIIPSQLAGWRFFHEVSTTLHLAAGGVSPTRKTLPSLVKARLDVCR